MKIRTLIHCPWLRLQEILRLRGTLSHGCAHVTALLQNPTTIWEAISELLSQILFMGLINAKKIRVVHEKTGKEKGESQEIYPSRMEILRWLLKKMEWIALAAVAQWIEHQPVNQKVTSSIPSQAYAWVAGHTDVSLTHWYFSPFLPPFSALQ